MAVEMTVQEKRRAYYQSLKSKGYYTRPCPLCDGTMSMTSIRCARHLPGRELVTICPNGGTGGSTCETKGPHRHCDCGEAIEADVDGRYSPCCAHCTTWAERMARKRLSRAS